MLSTNPQMKLDNELTTWIVTDCRPIKTIENQGLQKNHAGLHRFAQVAGWKKSKWKE